MGDTSSPHRSRSGRQLLLGWLLILSLIITPSETPAIQILQTSPASTRLDASGDELIVMPPHPRLDAEIEQGDANLPEATQKETGHSSSSGAGSQNLESGAQSYAPLSGSINVLAVLVDFSDKTASISSTYFDNLIYAAPKAGIGSVRDYYSEVSYAKVDIVTLNLPSSFGWKRAPGTYASYVNGKYCTDGIYPNNCQKLAEDIVDILHQNSTIDFSQYDNDHNGLVDTLMIIHAGSGAEYTYSKNDIWSHSWSMYSPRYYDGVYIWDYVIMPEYYADNTTGDMTVGVFAHELAHSLWNLPDLYDRDYSSLGVGDWSLMAGGSWNGPGWNGSAPAWPDAWSRIQMGFITPTIVTNNRLNESIEPVLYGSSSDSNVYQLESSSLGADEYFLVENRQRISGSYDYYLPGEGLLIWRVDEAMWGIRNDKECSILPHWQCPDNAHYLVALEQADGFLELEKRQSYGDSSDPFGSSPSEIQTFSLITSPDTSSYYGTGDTGITIDGIQPSTGDPNTILANFRIFPIIVSGPPVAYLPLLIR